MIYNKLINNSQNSQIQQKNPNNRIIGISLVVLLILFGVGTFMIPNSHNGQTNRVLQQQPNQLQNSQIPTEPIAKLPDEQQFTTLMQKAESAHTKQSYLSSAVSLKNYAAQTQNADNRYNALLEDASLYASSSQYQEALDAFKQTEQIKGITFPECNGAGLMAKLLKEKQTAIYYFQKCISLIPADYPTRTATIEWFNEQISQLNKG